MTTDESFKKAQVLQTIRGTGRMGTRMAAEPKDLITQYARTKLQKASFAMSSVSDPHPFYADPDPT